MKICFIVGAFPTMKCGIGDYTHRLSEALAEKGHEVHIITSKKATIKSTKLHIHNIVEEWNMKSMKIIINKLKLINPEVINIQYPSNEYNNNIMINLLPIKIKKIIKCKISITIHEYECFTLKRKIRNYLTFMGVDKIIVVEEEFVDIIKKDFSKIEIVYIPISSSIPRSQMNDEKRNQLIKRYNLDSKYIISYFGFAVPSKGIELLMKCISKLENVKLLFINELSEENEYHKTLINLIDELNIKDKIIITGFLENQIDVADLIQISDVCVLPFTDGVKKRNSSFLAAYNQEVPVITTHLREKDCNGIYYVEPNNEEQLLKKIQIVLESKEKVNRDILNLDLVAEKYIKIFK